MLRLRVKEVAEKRGYNMSSLSRASNLSFRTVVHLFKRPESDTNISTLEKIALVLGVQIGDLVERVPDTQN
jgi:DNA-binding Xre family transcriptional regulator